MSEFTAWTEPGANPIVKGLGDFTPEALDALRNYLTQQPLSVPISQQSGYIRPPGTIGSAVVTGSAVASFDFSSIPATPYRHLQIVLMARGDTAAANVSVGMRFNGDTGANYLSAAAPSNPVSTGNRLNLGTVPAANEASASRPGSSTTVIPYYALTTLYHPYHCHGGWASTVASTSADSFVWAGEWSNTAAINRVVIYPVVGNFVVGSACTLYGIV